MGSKITQLTEVTAPSSGDDPVEIVINPATTPASRKIKLSNLFAAMQTWVFGADAGASDTYVVTLSPAPAAYVTGQHYRFKANTANTGACTINFNGLGAKTIKKAAGGITTDLADNDIRAGQWVDLVYDGTNMQMQSTLGNAVTGGSGGVGDVVGPASATDNALVRFDTTTGKLIQDSPVTLDDTGAITVPEMVAPSTPGANKVALYAKADGKLYIKDDVGTETDLTATGTVAGSPFELVVACSDLTTALTAGTAKNTFPWPRAVTLTSVHAFLVTPQTSGSIFTVDVNEGGVSILSTKITIDNGESDSTTAATPPVISDASLAAMASITVDIDQVGDGTAKGLYLVFVGTRA